MLEGDQALLADRLAVVDARRASGVASFEALPGPSALPILTFAAAKVGEPSLEYRGWAHRSIGGRKASA
jgi:hypothetical protein